jgi:protein-L-isoaspartate(D-aspartate) O-methyltransferase
VSVVPRAAFVPESARHDADLDTPLAIGWGQTISQPSLVAWMTQELAVQPGHRVLEIGTGSGYQTALLLEMGADVWSLERIPELAERARATLAELGYRDRLHLRTGSGYAGWPEASPFDRIILTAAPAEVPAALIDQLADPGRLVGPTGVDVQVITTVDKRDGQIVVRPSVSVRFVPMV